MKYCHECGFKLPLGTEKFCPECGQDLIQKKEANRIGITDTKGDVIGTGIKGTGHFFGKEIGYTVQGNVINLNISGGNISKEFIDSLQKIINTPTQIEQKSLTEDTAYDKDIKDKLDEANETQKQITNILQEVSNIEKKEGTQQIQEIRSENIQISTKELLLKEHILKGNEYYYKKEYYSAIKCYDKALEIDANRISAWNNKGAALDELGKYDEAIQYFDKALEINSSNANVWNNKGNVLSKLGKYDEAIQYFDKALEIDANYANVWNNKGNVLSKLGKYDEAIQCYDKALEIDANHTYAWNNKGAALDELGKHDEAIQCYDKALEIDANYAGAWYNKGMALDDLGKNDEAIQCYDKALEIEPNNSIFNETRRSRKKVYD